jgi:glycosyltransferase involved in cell wall biosynthesis
MGQAATLNKGWAMAEGEILGYLSADDFLYPGAVSAAVSALTPPDVIATYCDFDLVDPAGRYVRQVRRPEFSLELMLTTLDCPPGPGAFFRRSAYEAAGGWNSVLRQIPDFDFWLRLARYGRFVHIPRTLAAWRVHPGSQSFAVAGAARAEESVHVISAFFAANDLDPRLLQLESRSKARAHLYCAQLHARAGRYRAAASNIVQAHRWFPGITLQWHTWRAVANALLSRPAHQLIWRLRKIIGAKA